MTQSNRAVPKVCRKGRVGVVGGVVVQGTDVGDQELGPVVDVAIGFKHILGDAAPQVARSPGCHPGLVPAKPKPKHTIHNIINFKWNG